MIKFYLATIFTSLLLCSCTQKSMPAKDGKTDADWDKSISTGEKDDLSSAFEGITDSMVELQLAGEKIPVNVVVKKHKFTEGSDDSINIKFVRDKHLDQPIHVDVSLESPREVIEAIGFSHARVSFLAQQSESHLIIPIVDNQITETSKIIKLDIKGPSYLDLSHSYVDLEIQDNDSVNIDNKLALVLKPSPENKFVGNIPSDIYTFGNGGSPKFKDDRIEFSGQHDSLGVLDHLSINSAEIYPHKTMAFALKTSSEIIRRQVVYEQGSEKNGLTVYIDRGKLYLGVFQELGELTSHAYISHGIEANTHYTASLSYDGDRGKVIAYLNGRLIGIKNGIPGGLKRHLGDIGIGAVNEQTRFHDQSSKKSHNFQGSISSILGFNSKLSPAEMVSLQKRLQDSRPVRNEVFVHQGIEEVTEGKQEVISIDVQLSEVQDNPITLKPHFSGTARIKQDVQMPEEVVIPRGQRFASFDLKILNDNISEFQEDLRIQFSTEQDIHLASSVTLRIVDDEGLSFVDQNSPWISFDEKGPVFHTDAVLQEKNYVDLPSYSEGNDKDYVFARFDGNKVLSFKKHPAINNAPYFKRKTIALSFKTSTDTNSRQIIYKQGNEDQGINIYIDKGFLFMYLFNHKKLRYHKDWGGHVLMAKIEPEKHYGVAFSFNSDKNRMVALINQQFIENAQAEIGALPRHKGSIDFGGALSSTSFHDGKKVPQGSYFRGDISEAIFYNDYLSHRELGRLSSYLQGRWIVSKFAGIR